MSQVVSHLKMPPMTPRPHRTKGLEAGRRPLPWLHCLLFFPWPPPPLLVNTMSVEIFPHPLCSLMCPHDLKQCWHRKKKKNSMEMGWENDKWYGRHMQIAMTASIYRKTLAQTKSFIREWHINCVKVKIWVGIASQIQMGKEPDIVALTCNPPYSRIWRGKATGSNPAWTTWQDPVSSLKKIKGLGFLLVIKDLSGMCKVVGWIPSTSKQVQ